MSSASSAHRRDPAGNRLESRAGRIVPCLAAAGCCVLLAGCQSEPLDGARVALLRELMVESARMREEAGKGPVRSDEAERAVGDWRGVGAGAEAETE